MSTTIGGIIYILCGIVGVFCMYNILFRGCDRETFDAELNNVPIFLFNVCGVLTGPLMLIISICVFVAYSDRLKKFQRDVLYKIISIGIKNSKDNEAKED